MSKTLLLSLLLLATIAPPAATGSELATPASEEHQPGSMSAMLDALPAMPLFDTELGEMAIISYFDQVAQLTAVGATPPTSLDDPAYDRWFQAVRGMPYLIRNSDFLLVPETEAQVGFTLFQLDQSVTYHFDDVDITLLRGRFDHERIEAALQGSGYEPVTVNGIDMLSIADDGETYVESPIGLSVAGPMTNAAFLPNGTLAFTSSRERMQAVFEVAASEAPSLAAQENIAPLVRTVRPDLVAAWITSGLDLAISDPLAKLASLEGTPDAAALASLEVAPGQVPPVLTFLLGVTAGGPLPRLGATEVTPEPPPPGMPVAQLQIGLVMPDCASAEAAVPVTQERLTTMRTSPSHFAAEELDDLATRSYSPSTRSASSSASRWS